MGDHQAIGRRVKRKVVVATAAVVTIAATFAAIANASGNSAPQPGAAKKPAADPGAGASALAAAIARDLKITPEQALALTRQDTETKRSVATLKKTLGDAFAGAWFDNSAKKLMVAVANPASAAAVRSAGAEPKVFANSLTKLTAAKNKLDELARTLNAPSVTSWFVEPQTNSVVIETKGDKSADTFVARAKSLGVPIRTVVSKQVVRPLEDLVGGQPFRVGPGVCSIGFPARAADGSIHFVTAGHCSESGGNVLIGGQRVGRVSASTFNREGDFALVDVTDDDAGPTPFFDAGDGELVAVKGSDAGAVGTTVCRSGQTSGVACGKILALNQTVNYGDGKVVNGLTRTDACAEPGDSGGPFISADQQAQGLTSGGTGDCETGGVTFFQPINEALQKLQVELVTDAE